MSGYTTQTVSAVLEGGVGGARGRVGVVLLAGDQTLEYELSSLLHPLGLGVFFSRVSMCDSISSSSLASMGERISEAASLLLPGVPLHILAYGCTSASAVLGQDKVFSQLSERELGAVKTTPATAAVAAFRSLGSVRIGLVTPYVGEVNRRLVQWLESQGPWTVSHCVTFGLQSDREVAAVSPDSIRKAALSVGAREDVDTVFISCTNLQTMGVLGEIERMLGKPVTSSNVVMAWHILSCLQVEEKERYKSTLGRLFGLNHLEERKAVS